MESCCDVEEETAFVPDVPRRPSDSVAIPKKKAIRPRQAAWLCKAHALAPPHPARCRTPAPPGAAGLGAASLCPRFHLRWIDQLFHDQSVIEIHLPESYGSRICSLDHYQEQIMRCIVRALWTSFSPQPSINPSQNTIIEEITLLQEACHVHDRRKWKHAASLCLLKLLLIL